MQTVTYADLCAIAVNTDNLPPMRGPRGKVRTQDAKRSSHARQDTIARKRIREGKTRELVSA